MKTYEFKLTEILSRIVRIDAESKDEAENAIERLYDNETIVLDADDLTGEVNIECIDTKNVINEQDNYEHYIIDEDGDISEKFD